MLVRSPSVLPEIEDMGITSPSRSFMQQRPPSTYTVAMIYATTPRHRYNREWRLEKLGFKPPLEARQAALLPLAA
ncbi:MAG: hypothetical protein VB125_03055 [Burkholderia sp.]